MLKDFSAPALVAAIEANSFEHWVYQGRSGRVELHDGPDVIWCRTGVAHSMLNWIGRARFVEGDVAAGIEEVLAHFKPRGLPLTWTTGPATRPPDLGRRLEAHGLAHVFDDAGMAADLLALNEDLPAPPPNFTIERVRQVDRLRQWISTLRAGFRLSDLVADAIFDIEAELGFGPDEPRRLYVGLLGGKPVATSFLFLGAGVAGLYGVVTVPEARRRGIGTAMTSMPLREARAMGYRIGILHSSPMGLGVYRRLGFEEYCKISHYVWGGEA